MTLFGIDYSASRPDPACLALNGVQFVGRYLEPAADWKTLKRAEADALRAAGIAIVGMYELGADRALSGFKAGAADALGVAAHLDDVGMPDDRPVYFAVDFDANATQLAGPVRDYFRGIASVMPMACIGAYGGYRTIRYLFDNALIGWGHQTYAWSRLVKGGPVVWDKRAAIQQYDNGESMCGAEIDLNRGMFPDIGQWPPPPPEDEVTDADLDRIITAVAALLEPGPPSPPVPLSDVDVDRIAAEVWARMIPTPSGVRDAATVVQWIKDDTTKTKRAVEALVPPAV